MVLGGREEGRATTRIKGNGWKNGRWTGREVWEEKLVGEREKV
jgi:hypothetical protein